MTARFFATQLRSTDGVWDPRDTRTIAEIVEDALDLLVELGGGTDDGAAEVLEELDMRGRPQNADDCPLTNWLLRELWRAGRSDFTELEVVPNAACYLGSEVYWRDVDLIDGRWTAFGTYHSVPLPPVLSDLGNDFDRGYYPELVAA